MDTEMSAAQPDGCTLAGSTNCNGSNPDVSAVPPPSSRWRLALRALAEVLARAGGPAVLWRPGARPWMPVPEPPADDPARPLVTGNDGTPSPRQAGDARGPPR
jgi:hypothetical protein